MISDAELIRLMSEEPDRGFRLLIEKYQQRIYTVVRRIIPSHEEADDLIQEIFIKIFRGIGGFKMESGLFTWIYRISCNESLNYLRRMKRNVELTDDLLFIGMNSDNLDTEKIMKDLLDIIASLPHVQQKVFVMRYFDELKYQEISEIMGVSPGSLKASYHHAVKKIEDKLNTINIY